MDVKKPSVELVGDVAEQAVEALRTRLRDRLVAVVLYGSRARGEAEAWSDWDLLVIAEGLPAKWFDRHMLFSELLPASCAGVTVVAVTTKEFQARVTSLYLDIALDGEVLYDPQEYAARKLAELKRLMDRLGLYRERTEAGDYWRWKEQPEGAWELAWES